MKLSYEIPIVNPTKKKEAFLNSLIRKYPKLVQWFLTVFEKEDLDFSNIELNQARSIVKSLCYPTKKRKSKYNCKGAIHLPRSNFYDTAITEAIGLWKVFRKRKRNDKTDKRFPEVKNCAPVFNSLMFELNLEKGWITLKTKRGMESVHIPVKVPNKSYYDELKERKVSCIRLKKKGDHLVFILIQKSSSPELPSPKQVGEDPVIGIDLGERRLASSVMIRLGDQQSKIMSAKFWRGKEVKELEHREHYIRRNLQKLGKSSSIPKRAWKAKNKRKDLCEKIAGGITEEAEKGKVKAVFVGDLKAPRPRNFGVLSRRLSNFPFGKLKEAIKRHLKKKGIFVKEIYEGKTTEETGTSLKCHRCGSEGERYKGSFSCPSCGLEDYNADMNAGINIVERGTKALGITEGLGALP